MLHQTAFADTNPTVGDDVTRFGQSEEPAHHRGVLGGLGHHDIGLLQLDEAPYEDLPSTGFSADYVRRETERAVAGVNGQCRIYPGIDLVFYGQERQLEYDFILAPGADPDVIRLAAS